MGKLRFGFDMIIDNNKYKFIGYIDKTARKIGIIEQYSDWKEYFNIKYNSITSKNNFDVTSCLNNDDPETEHKLDELIIKFKEVVLIKHKIFLNDDNFVLDSGILYKY